MKRRKVMGLAIALAAALTVTSVAPVVSNPIVAEAATAGWVQSGTQWWYRNADGTYPANQWKQVNGKWYYFDAAGWMTTGWQKVNGVWYYMDASGAMTTGWQKVNGVWYYMDASGAMTTGWQKVNNVWYYMYSNGAMAADTWIGDYYVGPNGAWQPDAKPEQDMYFDFADDVEHKQAEIALVPEAAKIDVTVADENGATGVELIQYAATDGDNYYLNAMVAGNKLTFTAENGKTIKKATTKIGDGKATALTIKRGKTVSVIPAAMEANTQTCENQVITLTMSDGTVYNINTLNEKLPSIFVNMPNGEVADAGVYSFAIDRFMLRVNTEGQLVYYRDMNCVGEDEENKIDLEKNGVVKELMCENFSAQVAMDGKNYYAMFVELDSTLRNANGGFSSGEYVVMDENYNDIDVVTLLPGENHGAGYLDQHEFVVLEDGHYLTLSYSPEFVSNLPEGTEGVDGTQSAYVWAGIFQEVKDGELVNELSTTDYAFLYDTAVEKRNYKGSTDQGLDGVAAGQATIFNLAEGWQDYVHVNSLDYTLDKDGNIDNLLVSMRDQSAVYQFDWASGEVEWILGGKAADQLNILNKDEVTTKRTDDDGNLFTALTFGQHDARYCGTDANGNTIISVFDNQTGIGPFLTTPTFPGAPITNTRTFQAVIDEKAGTANIVNIVVGQDLNKVTNKYHIASHCGSVNYQNYAETGSIVIGWGLHGVIDAMPAIPVVGMDDANYPELGKLHQGSRPIFTEITRDGDTDTVKFELSVLRNATTQAQEGLFSYRTYKTAE